MTADKDRFKLLGLIGLTVLVVFLSLTVAVQTLAIMTLVAGPEEGWDELAGLLEMFVDQQIDAGYADPLGGLDDPLLADRKVLINHSINARSAKDVSARLLYLDSQDPSRPIDLYISTPGGWVDSAFTIIDSIQLISAPVNTWAIGGCYSSGALILASGTGRRYATENALIMIHANQEDSDGDYTFERLALERYQRVWQVSANLPAEWFPMVFDASYYLSPDEALEFGIIDEIVPPRASP